MKNHIAIGWVLLAFMSVACSKESANARQNRTSGVEVTLRDYTDSRCPLDANCVWAGEATVMLTVTDGNDSIDFTLHGIGADTVLMGHRIEFVDLLPYPVCGEEVEKEVELTITEL